MAFQVGSGIYKDAKAKKRVRVRKVQAGGGVCLQGMFTGRNALIILGEEGWELSSQGKLWREMTLALDLKTKATSGKPAWQVASFGQREHGVGGCSIVGVGHPGFGWNRKL